MHHHVRHLVKSLQLMLEMMKDSEMELLIDQRIRELASLVEL